MDLLKYIWWLVSLHDHVKLWTFGNWNFLLGEIQAKSPTHCILSHGKYHDLGHWRKWRDCYRASVPSHFSCQKRKKGSFISVKHFPFFIYASYVSERIVFFQDISPVPWKLAEKVLSDCKVILKSYAGTIKELIKSDPGDYAEVITVLCQNAIENEPVVSFLIISHLCWNWCIIVVIGNWHFILLTMSNNRCAFLFASRFVCLVLLRLLMSDDFLHWSFLSLYFYYVYEMGALKVLWIV